MPTRWNEGGTGKERSRGWARVPPDPEKLEELGPGIVAQLQQLGVKRLVSSDLPRAARTAEWLGREMNVPVEATRRLRTWNTGEMAGKLERETIPQRKKYMKYPDMKPPGGEPFEEFLARFGPELRSWLRHNEEHPDEPAAIVVHGHMVLAVPAALNGPSTHHQAGQARDGEAAAPKIGRSNRGEVDPEELDRLDREFPPGSVILVRAPKAPRSDEVSGHPPEAHRKRGSPQGAISMERIHPLPKRNGV